MGLFTKQQKPKEVPACVKIRKLVMNETLEYLKQLRKELEQTPANA
jgi:hypothetical protein